MKVFFLLVGVNSWTQFSRNCTLGKAITPVSAILAAHEIRRKGVLEKGEKARLFMCNFLGVLLPGANVYEGVLDSPFLSIVPSVSSVQNDASVSPR